MIEFTGLSDTRAKLVISIARFQRRWGNVPESFLSIISHYYVHFKTTHF